mmetsp:Transcript_35082/g.88634  ORF Transcript_35082/g.88634 Transcript_35082/m.88634 type:complete len:280 (+) Transcript_35082:744-1583(+)
MRQKSRSTRSFSTLSSFRTFLTTGCARGTGRARGPSASLGRRCGSTSVPPSPSSPPRGSFGGASPRSFFGSSRGLPTQTSSARRTFTSGTATGARSFFRTSGWGTERRGTWAQCTGFSGGTLGPSILTCMLTTPARGLTSWHMSSKRSRQTPTTVGSSSARGTPPTSASWRSPPATCSASFMSTLPRASSAARCTSAPATWASASPSTLPATRSSPASWPKFATSSRATLCTALATLTFTAITSRRSRSSWSGSPAPSPPSRSTPVSRTSTASPFRTLS